MVAPVMCEKCWADAGMRAFHRGGSQVDHYEDLLRERKDTPCTAQEQAGPYWDEVKKRDTRMAHA